MRTRPATHVYCIMPQTKGGAAAAGKSESLAQSPPSKRGRAASDSNLTQPPEQEQTEEPERRGGRSGGGEAGPSRARTSDPGTAGTGLDQPPEQGPSGWQRAKTPSPGGLQQLQLTGEQQPAEEQEQQQQQRPEIGEGGGPPPGVHIGHHPESELELPPAPQAPIRPAASTSPAPRPKAKAIGERLVLPTALGLRLRQALTRQDGCARPPLAPTQAGARAGSAGGTKQGAAGAAGHEVARQPTWDSLLRGCEARQPPPPYTQLDDLLPEGGGGSEPGRTSNGGSADQQPVASGAALSPAEVAARLEYLEVELFTAREENAQLRDRMTDLIYVTQRGIEGATQIAQQAIHVQQAAQGRLLYLSMQAREAPTDSARAAADGEQRQDREGGGRGYIQTAALTVMTAPELWGQAREAVRRRGRAAARGGGAEPPGQRGPDPAATVVRQQGPNQRQRKRGACGPGAAGRARSVSGGRCRAARRRRGEAGSGGGGRSHEPAAKPSDLPRSRGEGGGPAAATQGTWGRLGGGAHRTPRPPSRGWKESK